MPTVKEYFNGKVVVVSGLPEGSTSFQLFGASLADELRFITMPIPGEFKNNKVSIPRGSWQIVKELSEEQARGIVERSAHGLDCYVNYEKDHYPFLTAVFSFSSFLKANNIDPEKDVILIKT